jgi:hypothetical protein
VLEQELAQLNLLANLIDENEMALDTINLSMGMIEQALGIGCGMETKGG